MKEKVRDWEDLKKILSRIQGKGYKAYRELEGTYLLSPGIIFFLDHAQPDPFATPSRVRIRVSMKKALYPSHLYSHPVRKMALENFILKNFSSSLKPFSFKRGTGNSGLFRVYSGGQEILKRSGCEVTPDYVEVRFRMGLPAEGRRIKGRELLHMLEGLKKVSPSLLYSNLSPQEVEEFVNLVEDVEKIREELRERRLVAFIKEGSILPRRSGVDERPLENAIPFHSPPPLKVSFSTLHHGKVEGMGIPEGVTLIVGGGFHGKTTLLNAIERGVYPHIPGDGREWVVSDSATVKVRSEDGRYIEGVDISPFIKDLPGGKDTTFFSTEDASGSTSLASCIMEALEMGARVLLLDEDTSATNFLIRDARMQRLISKDREPITPFIDKARLLYRELKVSTILVLGGSGDYLEVADTVIGMNEYVPEDLTQEARKVCQFLPSRRKIESEGEFGKVKERIVLKESFSLQRKDKVRSKGVKEIVLGKDLIDVSDVEQIVEETQLRCIGEIMRFYGKKMVEKGVPLRESIEQILKLIEEEGFQTLTRYPPPDLSLPRIFEVASAFNRWGSLRVKQKD